MPKVSDEMLRAVKTIGGSLTGPVAADMARELELARKVIAAARDHERWCSIKLSCQLCAAMREYDAGETSKEQNQPRRDEPDAQSSVMRGAAANTLGAEVVAGVNPAAHEPRKPSFAEAAGNIIRTGYASRAVGVTWSGILDVIERARRASGE